MSLGSFLVRRLVRVILSLIAVSVIAFTLLQLAPGEFADIVALTSGSTGLSAGETDAAAADISARFGGGIPAWQQYVNYMRGLATLDLGYSYQYPQFKVEELIATAFPVSATLALTAIVLALAIAIPVGAIAASRRGTGWDFGGMLVVTSGHALPNYLAGVALVLIFSSVFHLLPTGGWRGPQYMIMPTIALAIGPAGVMARYVRSSMLETLSEDYIVTARSKGGSPLTVSVRHALRNSLIPLVTIAGPQLANLLTGTIFVEAVFSIPGLGSFFASAARFRDMPLLMGTTLFFAALLMVMNLIVDLLYAVLDPRTRASLGLVRRVTTDSLDAIDKPLLEMEPT
jgi:peptide/nickel transport system permease protein